MMERRTFLKLAASLPLVGAARAEIAPVPLKLTRRILEVKGKAAKVFGILGPNGKPGLEMVYGSPFNVELQNDLGEATIIHWHGLTPPVELDGVPHLAGKVLEAADKRLYKFDNKVVGTHWMHSHLGLQEQQLLAAPLIVHETAKPVFDELDHVVMIHDFTFRDPQEILNELKGGGGAHAAHMNMKMDADDASKDNSEMDHSKMDHSKMDGGAMAPAMAAMSSDVKYDAILANDRTLDDPEVVMIEKGGTVRLRLINGAAATNVWVELGALQGQLIAVDGNAVKPMLVSRFPLGIAQRADVRITLPKESGAWPVLFQSEGETLRGGIVLRTGEGAVAKVSDQGKAGEAMGLEFEAMLRVPYALQKLPLEQREMVMLTGGDNGYDWGLNGKTMMHDVLFKVKQGRRVEIMMHNMTKMSHPMHLHGHYFQVTSINGTTLDGAQRDTIVIPPDQMVTVEFNADNPGQWAFHCHHLYHQNSGMMGSVAYA